MRTGILSASMVVLLGLCVSGHWICDPSWSCASAESPELPGWDGAVRSAGRRGPTSAPRTEEKTEEKTAKTEEKTPPAPKDPAKESHPNARTFPCERAGAEIVIDGKLDDRDWKKAPRIKLARHWDGVEPSHAGYARVLWDDKYLYFAAEFEDEDLFAELDRHDDKCWFNDVFEIFVLPDFEKKVYFEMHVTPKNTTMDLSIDRKGAKKSFPDLLKWESGMVTAVATDGTLNRRDDRDRGWTAEVRVPLSAFAEASAAPKPGDRWLFACCRYDYSVYEAGGKVLSSTANLTKQDFHRIEDYDWLEFRR